MTQAKFTPGIAAWLLDVAPSRIQDFTPAFNKFGAGTTGITIAPGTHVGILEDEFGSTAFGAIRLPSTSGAAWGTPIVQDWVSAVMPNDPTGAPWVMTLDPHGLTAYVSPNTGKAIGLIMNDQRTFIALVDIEGLLSAKRLPGTHVIDPTATAGVMPASPCTDGGLHMSGRRAANRCYAALRWHWPAQVS